MKLEAKVTQGPPMNARQSRNSELKEFVFKTCSALEKGHTASISIPADMEAKKSLKGSIVGLVREYHKYLEATKPSVAKRGPSSWRKKFVVSGSATTIFIYRER